MLNIKRSLIDDELDDTEKLAIQMFVDNTKQMEAVKKVILWEVYNNGVIKKGKPAQPLRNFALGIAQTTNNPIEAGQKLFAMNEGVAMLEAGFRELLKYSKINEKVVGDEKKNIAR